MGRRNIFCFASQARRWCRWQKWDDGGWRLERGRRDATQAHALFGALAVLGAAVAAIAGFVLLP